ncbi:Aspartyl/asparaginyl beta-hydroxylase, partial [Ophiophagus hannah]
MLWQFRWLILSVLGNQEAKHGGNKSAKKEGVSGSSFFTWFMVIALLGVWTSVAVVWFELVDYEEVLGLTKDGNNENIDSLEEVLNILAEESSDWFYGFLSFLYDVMTPFEIIEEEENDATDDVDMIKESAKKTKEKQQIKKDAKEEEKKKTKKKIEDFDVKDEKIDDKSKKDSHKMKQDRKTGKEKSELDKNHKDKDTKVLANDKDKEVKKLAKRLKERSVPEQSMPRSAEEVIQPAEKPHVKTEKGELDEEKGEIEKGEIDEHHEETDFQEEEEKEDNNELSEEPTTEQSYDKEKEDKIPEITEKSSSTQEVLNDDFHMEEGTNEPEIPESAPENTEQPDHVEEEETIDHPEQIHERDADVPDSVTEPIQSVHKEEHTEDHVAAQHDTGHGEKETLQKEKVKKKKPKLLNKFDKSIKVELDAAEKLRKKGKTEEALTAFEALVSKYPRSPRARYGKAQSEDDLAEKMRSNDILQRSITTYGEVANLPNVPDDLVKMALKRRADRQQFLGRMRGSLVTLQKLVDQFPNDTSFKNNLGVGYLLIGDNNNAKKVYKEVLRLAPNDGFAKVHYGFILKAENKIEESIPYLKEGLETGDPGTDDGRFYFHLGDAMQRVGNKEAYKWYELGYQRGHFASVWQRSLYNVKGLKAQPWWTAKETGYTELIKSLEKNWKVIRDEGLAVMDRSKGLFLPEDENLREKGDWSQFTLWQQGRKNENACNSVPKSCALLERFSEATGCRRGQIKYSVMHPGTHVWPHTGPTNCRLRMHLGLVIPKEGCRIRFWEEGKILIFDDSFEHEVWQDANAYRLIFIVDVWHPELTDSEALYEQQSILPVVTFSFQVKGS